VLQGGGSHGPFVWGILDGFLDEKKFEIAVIAATSAGPMTAVVCADRFGTSGSANMGWPVRHSARPTQHGGPDERLPAPLGLGVACNFALSRHMLSLAVTISQVRATVARAPGGDKLDHGGTKRNRNRQPSHLADAE
jgi:hypothetical protein